MLAHMWAWCSAMTGCSATAKLDDSTDVDSQVMPCRPKEGRWDSIHHDWATGAVGVLSIRGRGAAMIVSPISFYKSIVVANLLNKGLWTAAVWGRAGGQRDGAAGRAAGSGGGGAAGPRRRCGRGCGRQCARRPPRCSAPIRLPEVHPPPPPPPPPPRREARSGKCCNCSLQVHQ